MDDACKLLENTKLLVVCDEISHHSVSFFRRWFKKLGRSKLYKNTTKILKLLRNVDPPPIDPYAIGRAKVIFCCVLRIRQKLGLAGNRCYYPLYIYKTFHKILEGAQR